MNNIPKRRIKDKLRICVVCGIQFLASTHAIEAGKTGGTCCSFSCVGKRKHLLHNQTGHRNPNYKWELAKSNVEHKQNFRQKYPEKAKAHDIVQNAIRNGSLIRQNCSICDTPNAEAHHEDYSKPLDIIWLCDKHHKEY